MTSDDFDAAIGAALEAEINAKTARADAAEGDERSDAGADAQADPEPAVAAGTEADAMPAPPASPIGAAQETAPDAIVYEVRGTLGVISLRRPEAMNAIDLDMVRAIDACVREADADTAIETIAIHAPDDRAFCAGGDIRKLWEWGRAGRRELFAFYREEYRLNRLLSRLKTPAISLMHGTVMGGGAGLALHSPHRVVSETVRFAMPEVGIGFVPDVGASRFLNTMPGRSGRYLALTGETVSAADLRWAGLADASVPRAQHDNLLDRLADGESVAEAVDAFAVDPAASDLERLSGAIDMVFTGDVDDMLDALDGYEGEHAEWAEATAALIRSRSPFSVRAAHGLMVRGEEASLEECLVNEFRAASRAVQRQDFYEGVRAAVIDKDREPRWRPASLADVDAAEIEALFEPSPMRDVSFDA